jgi:sarcosine oxidase, subunit alpha
MSTRLAKGGRLIDRAAVQEFTFNGKRLRGCAGDTLASALLANDQMLVGRSPSSTIARAALWRPGQRSRTRL